MLIKEKEQMFSIHGEIKMPFSIEVMANEDFEAVQNAIELLNSYNADISCLKINTTSNQTVNLAIHDFNIEWQNVFPDESINKKVSPRESALVTNV